MKQKEFGIYSITNTCTGDMYIGQTVVSFEERWNQHKRELRNNKHENSMLQRAFNKYGEEAFIYRILHLCDELDDVNELEKYYIKKYDTYNNGYNLTLGGEGYLIKSDEVMSEIRRKIKEKVRDKSKFTLKQIENVKIMLSKPSELKQSSKIEYISEKTGVNKSVIYSILKMGSWVDVREDLNEQIVLENEKNKLVKFVVDDFLEKELTINEISQKYELTAETVRTYLKKNKIAISELNKMNKQKKQKKVILDLFSNGVTTLKELSEKTGYGSYIIHKVLDENGTSIRKPKKESKKRTNKEKNCGTKGVSWDIPSQKWYLRITYGGKQIPIGRFEKMEEAIEIKKEIDKLKDNNDLDGILKIKEQYRREGVPKKKVKVINIFTGEIKEIEGINETARVLNLDNEKVRDVLRGKRKTHKGYRFEYC